MAAGGTVPTVMAGCAFISAGACNALARANAVAGDAAASFGAVLGGAAGAGSATACAERFRRLHL